MKTRSLISELIYVIFILFFFYEGIYKIAYWNNYSIWLHHAPLLAIAWVPLTYLIPVGEVMLSLILLMRNYRVIALHFIIIALLIYVFWIMSVYLFTTRVFWPQHALWENPTWLQKMLISVGLCWLAFIAIFLSRNTFPTGKEHNKNQYLVTSDTLL